MTSTKIFLKASRLAAPFVLLLAFSAPVNADDNAPKLHIKSVTVSGQGSIAIMDGVESPVDATFYGDASFVLTTDSGDVLKITMNNGDFSASLNDEPINSARIVTEDGMVRVLDKAGDTLFEARIPIGFQRAKSRVMLGVMVSTPGKAMATQLGLKPDAVVISQIIPGAPAAKAGLKPYDVLLKVDGEPVSQGNLTDAISAKKEGDTVTLEVLRDGKPREITAVLELVCPEGWSVGPAGVGSDQFSFPQTFNWDTLNETWPPGVKQLGELQKKYDSMARGFRAWDQSDTARALRDQLEKIRKDATLSEKKRVEIEQALKRALDAIKEFNIDVELPAIELFNNRDDDHGAVVFPGARPRGAAGRGGAGSSSRLDSLEKRLDRIESMLEKLLKRQSAPPDRKPPSAPSDKNPTRT